MAILQLQDGRKIQIQDGATPDQIDSLLSDLSRTPADATPEMNNARSAAMGLQNAAATESNITNRPSPIDTFKKEYNKPTDWNHPLASMVKPAVLALKGLNIPLHGAESAISNVAMNAQEGNFNPIDAAKSAYAGATGERPGEFGDIYNRAGLPFSKTLGLATNLALGNAASAGQLGDIANAVKGAPARAARIMSINSTAKRAGLSKVAAADINNAKEAIGNGIKDWHADAGGQQIAPTKESIDALKSLSKEEIADLLKKNTSGILDGKGQPILKLEDLYNMRQAIKPLKANAYAARTPDQPYVDAERALQEVIMKQADPKLEALNSQYHNLSDISRETSNSLTNSQGLVDSTKLTKLIKSGSPEQIDRANALREKIPSVDKLYKTIKNEQRWKAISGVLGKDTDFGARLAVAGTVAKKVLTGH